jgi:hypothetical protein
MFLSSGHECNSIISYCLLYVGNDKLFLLEVTELTVHNFAVQMNVSLLYRSQIETEPYLHLRYEGTDCALMCSGQIYTPTEDSCQFGDFQKSFLDR